MSYASVSDVVGRAGKAEAEYRPAQLEQIRLLLDDAEAMILGRIPDLAARVAAATVAVENLIRIEATAVKRVVGNADGFVEESIDGWTGRRDPTLAAGLLYLTDAEWAELLPTLSSRRRGSLRLVAYGEL